MKFTRLRLTGFKSFCDPTDLYLEPGLTGVVGPNGCGKSNLVEALRWVMGESSYKAMRAAGMDEVIFSGSANRPGRNSAEVTVFLDNSDRTAPAALNNADLLEVTRRIEREAGSVYRVNGREVRARDVQLLFADASTGAHSPALVRQGQIGELIAAKPVQRRALLEEAAGISGLHSRRHEAELRLRAAEQNLERVDDVVAQVEQQLDTLKRQARLATRYRNISGDIRKAEATLYHIRWVKARYSEKEAEASQGKLIAQLADATHLERQTAQRLATAEERVEPLRNAEASAAAALQRLTLLRQQLDDEMRRADVRRAELEDRQKQIVADCGRERDLMSEADALIAQYAQEQSELDREAANEQEAAEAARNNAERVRTRLEAAEQTARSAADTLARLRADRTQAERSAADAAGRAERLEQRIGDIDGELADIEAELQADETVAERTSELEAAKAQSSRAEERALAAEQAVADRQDALDAVRPALAEIEAKVSSLDAEAATLTRVLNADGETLWPAIVDALTVSSGYETALGAALGSDLDASSDSGASLYWSEPGDGSTDPALPEDAEPLSRYVTGPDLLARRLAQIGLVELDAGFRLMRHLKPGQRLVTRDGDLWRWDGFVVAADAPTAAAQRLSQRNRLRELDGEIAAARSRRDEMHASSATLAERLDNARTAEREARETWRGAQRQIATAQTTLDAAQATSTRLTARKSALEDTRARLAGDREEAEAAAGTANKALAETGDEAAAQQAADDAQKALSELRASAEQARVTLGGFENATRLRQNRLQQIARDAESWRRRKADAATQLETLERRRHEIAEQLKTLNATPDSFAARRNALDEDIAAAEADHRTASDRMTEAQTGHREADKAARAAADALSHAREELARVEERMKGFIAQRRQIEETIQENLDIPAAKTAEIAGLGPEAPLPDADAVERKLDRLKSERERLGGVNLGAEREAETIREKLETMVNDREDLIAAIAKLRSGISSLNREGRARLTDAFDRVNAHFQDLFISLFGGGNAQLQFVESDDPLDAGLEILARPPGKKPQTMTLLSGGEQALTALSLIFAVFLTNPAPICVLDEVDAPLDDANVDRFCTLLETMRARTDTRFVTITHNPITMSRVDRLFGVTMAERGVSQLVSVDLKTAHEVAEAG